jgi:hypothetical protein
MTIDKILLQGFILASLWCSHTGDQSTREISPNSAKGQTG